MSKEIRIPPGLTEEQQIEFIRQTVRDVGGDPDTLYPIDIELPAGAVPFEGSFEVTLKYDNYATK